MTKEEIIFEIKQLDEEIDLKSKRRQFLTRQLDQIYVLEKEYIDNPQLLQE